MSKERISLSAMYVRTYPLISDYLPTRCMRILFIVLCSENYLFFYQGVTLLFRSLEVNLCLACSAPKSGFFLYISLSVRPSIRLSESE